MDTPALLSNDSFTIYLNDEQLQAIHSYLSSIPASPAAQDIPVLRALPR